MSTPDDFPESPCRWNLPEVPLDYFRTSGKDFFGCPEGVYQLGKSDEIVELMEVDPDSSPDIFGVSDIGIDSVDSVRGKSP